MTKSIVLLSVSLLCRVTALKLTQDDKATQALPPPPAEVVLLATINMDAIIAFQCLGDDPSGIDNVFQTGIGAVNGVYLPDSTGPNGVSVLPDPTSPWNQWPPTGENGANGYAFCQEGMAVQSWMGPSQFPTMKVNGVPQTFFCLAYNCDSSANSPYQNCVMGPGGGCTTAPLGWIVKTAFTPTQWTGVDASCSIQCGMGSGCPASYTGGGCQGTSCCSNIPVGPGTPGNDPWEPNLDPYSVCQKDRKCAPTQPSSRDMARAKPGEPAGRKLTQESRSAKREMAAGSVMDAQWTERCLKFGGSQDCTGARRFQ